MQALLDEMELGTSGLMDAETAPEVGVLLRTGYVAGGDILQGTTAELEINASVFDVPLDKFTPLQPVVGSVNEIAKLEKKVLFSILAHMQITLSPKKKAELAHPLSTSTAALLALFAGIDYSDRGLYLRAAQMYKQALQEDPKLKMAKDALEELKGMGLVTAEELGEKKIKKQITAAATTAPPTATGSTAPKTDEGLSTGNIVAIGLGMAAVGGGLALALGGQSDDDSSPTPAADPDDTTPPTVAADPAEKYHPELHRRKYSFFLFRGNDKIRRSPALKRRFNPAGMARRQGLRSQLVISRGEHMQQLVGNHGDLERVQRRIGQSAGPTDQLHLRFR